MRDGVQGCGYVKRLLELCLHVWTFDISERLCSFTVLISKLSIRSRGDYAKLKND